MKERWARRALFASILFAGCGQPPPDIEKIPTPPPPTEPTATPGTPPPVFRFTQTPMFTPTATIIILRGNNVQEEKKDR